MPPIGHLNRLSSPGIRGLGVRAGAVAATAGTGWRTASGLVGLALFGLAMYAAWAAELEDALGRTILPLGRRGKGKTAVHGSLREQVNQIATKPGVREQL